MSEKIPRAQGRTQKAIVDGWTLECLSAVTRKPFSAVIGTVSLRALPRCPPPLPLVVCVFFLYLRQTVYQAGRVEGVLRLDVPAVNLGYDQIHAGGAGIDPGDVASVAQGRSRMLRRLARFVCGLEVSRTCWFSFNSDFCALT